jgi:serine protease
MLDAGAAVQAAQNVVVARIAAAPAAPLAGQMIVLSAAGSAVGPGRSIASAHWVLSDGGGIVDGFAGSADAVTVSVVPTAAGRFSVSVTVTDNLGSSASTGSSVDVQWDAGGGGGGALGLPWLVALAISVLAVARVSRRKGQARSQ